MPEQPHPSKAIAARPGSLAQITIDTEAPTRRRRENGFQALDSGRYL
jgi:hypothetical protein